MGQRSSPVICCSGKNSREAHRTRISSVENRPHKTATDELENIRKFASAWGIRKMVSHTKTNFIAHCRMNRSQPLSLQLCGRRRMESSFSRLSPPDGHTPRSSGTSRYITLLLVQSHIALLYIASAVRGNLHYICWAFALFVAAATTAYPASGSRHSRGPRAFIYARLISLSLLLATAAIISLFISILALDKYETEPSTVHARVPSILMLSVSCTHPWISAMSPFSL